MSGVTSSQAISWVQGFAANAPNSFMVNYGSADGCSTGCGSGWSLYDYWYLSYGYYLDEAAPQIYYSGDAADWGAVSSYGATSQNDPINFLAVQDEYDRDSSTDSPTQAWADFWSAMTSYGVSGYIGTPYSIEIWVEP